MLIRNTTTTVMFHLISTMKAQKSLEEDFAPKSWRCQVTLPFQNRIKGISWCFQYK